MHNQLHATNVIGPGLAVALRPPTSAEPHNAITGYTQRVAEMQSRPPQSAPHGYIIAKPCKVRGQDEFDELQEETRLEAPFAVGAIPKLCAELQISQVIKLIISASNLPQECNSREHPTK